jgi:hypothetical protein
MGLLVFWEDHHEAGWNIFKRSFRKFDANANLAKEPVYLGGQLCKIRASPMLSFLSF